MKSVKNLEMQSHVSEVITIDSFQAKLGKDEDVSVIKLQTDNKSVAEDLVHFIETGSKFVLDADNSPAKNGIYIPLPLPNLQTLTPGKFVIRL